MEHGRPIIVRSNFPRTMGRLEETRDFQGPQAASEEPEGSFAGSAGLHIAKEKITKEKVLEKKTELHRQQRKGKIRWAGQVFQAINNEGAGFRK